MQSSANLLYTEQPKTSSDPLEDPLAREVILGIEVEHRREMRRLSDLAFTFLTATQGNTDEAERLLDDAINLLFENGALSTWRYRAVLAAVREGL